MRGKYEVLLPGKDGTKAWGKIWKEWVQGERRKFSHYSIINFAPSLEYKIFLKRWILPKIVWDGVDTGIDEETVLKRTEGRRRQTKNTKGLCHNCFLLPETQVWTYLNSESRQCRRTSTRLMKRRPKGMDVLSSLKCVIKSLLIFSRNLVSDTQYNSQVTIC